MTYPHPIDEITDDVIATLRANREKVIAILQRNDETTHRELEVILGDVRAEMQRNYKIQER
jgi:hypothetical protein